MTKPAYSPFDQIALLKARGMIFKDEQLALECLKRVNYFHLRPYWLSELDRFSHVFRVGIYFEDIVERYEFDRGLRLLLYPSIELIEITVRSKLINYLSLSYGALWYMDSSLFESSVITKAGVTGTTHLHTLDRLRREFARSKESFIQEYHLRGTCSYPESWIIMEVASLGTVSKFYKSLHVNLRERGLISKELGVNSPRVFASWLEVITQVRNIIAHHMVLWDRVMEKRPKMRLKNPCGLWFTNPLTLGQLTSPFSTISCIVYLCNHLTESDELKHQILSLIKSYPNVPISKYGFFNHWETEPIWRV